ncbi:hypothetical protein ES703_27664 [subsurface metagenome]
MNKLETKLPRGGQRVVHGGYSFMTTGRLPEHRAHVRRYLTGAREGLIRDLGPTEADLTVSQIILIDRVVTKLGVIRCIEEHIRENSVMVGDTLAPSLKATYLAFDNSLRLALQALGIKSKKTEGIMELGKYVEEKYGKSEEAKQKVKV